MVRHSVSSFAPGWLPLAMGSLPHTNPQAAWKTILHHLDQVPGWPQLPKRSSQESAYLQFAEHFPAVSVQNSRLLLDRSDDLDQELNDLYLAYLEYDLSFARISDKNASGLALLREDQIEIGNLAAIKTHLTGPMSFGLSVIDKYQRPIIYDRVMADAIAKHTRLKAAYLEQELGRFAPVTITILEEPYMASFGSEYVSLTRAQVQAMLNEVMTGIEGIRGVHCCGNTDWSIVLDTLVELISIDAYDYGQSLAELGTELQAFLERGGIICWGIVPAGAAARNETAVHLVSLLEKHLDQLQKKGVDRDLLLGQGMVSPSCGLGSLNVPLAEHVLDLTRQVSDELRRRYIVQDIPSPIIDTDRREQEGSV